MKTFALILILFFSVILISNKANSQNKKDTLKKIPKTGEALMVNLPSDQFRYGYGYYTGLHCSYNRRIWYRINYDFLSYGLRGFNHNGCNGKAVFRREIK